MCQKLEASTIRLSSMHTRQALRSQHLLGHQFILRSKRLVIFFDLFTGIATSHRLPDLIFCSCFRLVEFYYHLLLSHALTPATALQHRMLGSGPCFLRLGTFPSPFFAFAAYGAPWFSLSSWCFLSSLLLILNVDVSVRRSAKKWRFRWSGYGQSTYLGKS